MNYRNDENKIEVLLMPLNEGLGREIPLPEAKTAGAAGVDLAASLDEPITLQPGERRLIPTGVAMQLPGPHVVGLVFARSGLASKAGIHLANGVGVIDSDYRGELKCPLVNSGDEPFVIRPGDRIAQMLFMPVFLADLVPVSQLDETERGEGGFGHTGV